MRRMSIIMFIHRLYNVPFISGYAQVKLLRSNLILDPRASEPNNVRFDCKYHDDGITVTITTDDENYAGDFELDCLFMRVYDPAHETIPDFDSTIYTYMGRDHENAPYVTTIGIVDPSVKTIKPSAFSDCLRMKKCIIHHGVETIEEYAFYECQSLEALFLPSSIKKIENWAFSRCMDIRILSIPTDIDFSQVGEEIIYLCDTFFQITQIPQYEMNRSWDAINNDQVHQAIIDFYRNAPPSYRVCLDVNVSVQAIHDCIVTHGTRAASIIDHDGMTPLHILSLNPHANAGSIQECFDADMSAAFVCDNRGNMPLEYLRENNLKGHTWLMTSLCMHCEAHGSLSTRRRVTMRCGWWRWCWGEKK